MHSQPTHLTAVEIRQGLADVLASPQDRGRLEAIFVRPSEGERRPLDHARLSPAGGIEGDRWATNHWQKLPDGHPDPHTQVSLMNARILRLIAGGEDAMRWAGDNLILDLDLSEANLPAGSVLMIGEVILELTSVSHTGCVKFAERYGREACDLINASDLKRLNLRGRFARIFQGGELRVGDTAAKS